jgi:hypothetical protein
MGRVSGTWNLPFLDAAELPGCYECRSWFLEAWCRIQRWPGESRWDVEDWGVRPVGEVEVEVESGWVRTTWDWDFGSGGFGRGSRLPWFWNLGLFSGLASV